jgi:hypothetical protein
VENTFAKYTLPVVLISLVVVAPLERTVSRVSDSVPPLPPPLLPPYTAVGVSNNPFDLTPEIEIFKLVVVVETLKLPAVPEVRVTQPPVDPTAPLTSGVTVTPSTSYV